MEPAGSDNEQLSRLFIFGNDDRSAPIRAILLLECIEGLSLGHGQIDVAAKPLC